MKNEFILTRNGIETFRGSENECFYKLQRSQSNSAQWAMKYEGWKISEVNPIFVKEWTPEQFTEAYQAITGHFAGKQLTTHKGLVKFPRNYKAIDTILGLAYTSSSSCAMLGICNVELRFDETFKYNHFVISKNGYVFAELWDNDENVKLLQLTF